ADELRRRFGPRTITRARLLKTGLPAPFERDFGTAAERRGEHAADVVRSGRKRQPDGSRPATGEPDAVTGIDGEAEDPDLEAAAEASDTP
ncbi:MAG: hypothetical protein ABIV26_01235, partial [Candidatus Limnocylindrales bacterium]